ncbi:myotrophin-like [Orbicella faveolata]|uniref:myotrophin-like n=1 Tax=Orbicella faveolata TaxID=48498 RepID=UPI0009E50590|nr:myotrophin-like [Orbicella faveolata]
MSILVTAIRSGNLEVVKEKFSRPGSQVNTPIQHGRSPLHIAVQAQKLDVMKYLVGKGADVNLADEDECSPLYYAVLNENKNLVEYLLQMGADPDGEDPEGNKLMDTVKDEAIKSMLKNV